ncbi:ABC transporter permease [Agrobacterium fabrum]|jgi:peptide/nickel transport system permease protein|nr:ABC transporter permease [Agrobacterium fabrum]KEY54322.1 ABC transporter permease [Agrobacterium tumefaciens]KJX90356.1 putative peptide permease protein [Agrobacterium tumefaciens]MCX2875454.1 ABC transporter permease [Agrobacterium fabrum]NMV70642.1 ABC transporter permease [Agrobacterium fabrum]QQN08998.1 ABC transporter permease [Agrobacterium fabrum]
MTLWIVQRLMQAILVALAMALIVFVGLHLIGSPIETLLPPEATYDDRLRLIADLGLDRPLYEQFFLFLKGLLQGNLGVSYVYKEPAVELILSRLPATLELAFAAVLLSLIVGVPLGLAAGWKPESPLARIIMIGSIFGFSLPIFWIAVLLIMIFSVQLGWLPSSGRGATEILFGIPWSFVTLDGLRHMLLPAISLSLFNISMVTRLTEAGVREAMSSEYVRFARAKGLSPKRILSVHVLKNVMIPVVTVVGLDIGQTIAFSVVTETIFAWPGVGKIIIDSIAALDRPVIVAYLMLVVVMFVIINLVVDVTYRLLDPRIRLQGE